jgi:ketosteroid isomerase-like protein
VEGRGASNREIVEAAYRAFDRGEIDAVLASFDPDIEWIEPDGYFPGARGTYRGIDAVRRIFETAYPRFWAEWRVVPDRVIEAGEQVVVTGDSRFRTHDGAEGSSRLCNIWTLRDGKTVRLEVFNDTALLWRALGGRPDYWD